MDVNAGLSVTRGLREGKAIIVSNRSSHNGGSVSLDDSPIEIVGLPPIQQSSTEEEEYREGEFANVERVECVHAPLACVERES